MTRLKPESFSLGLPRARLVPPSGPRQPLVPLGVPTLSWESCLGLRARPSSPSGMPQGSVGRWGCEKKCIVGSRPGGGGGGPGWIPRRRRRRPEDSRPRSRSRGRLDGTGWATAGGTRGAQTVPPQIPFPRGPLPLLLPDHPYPLQQLRPLEVLGLHPHPRCHPHHWAPPSQLSALPWGPPACPLQLPQDSPGLSAVPRLTQQCRSLGVGLPPLKM